jgi:VWFA-related protein
MHMRSRIRAIVLSFAALLFVLNAQTQTADPLQVIKAETANAKRTWGRKSVASVTTTYESFEFDSCTLTFKTKTLTKKNDDNSQKTLYSPEIYRYSFPLKSMDAGLEWLDTYNSYVISLSSPDSIITIEASRPTGFFQQNVVGNKGPAPNVSIPFANENSAKRVKMALQDAIAACGGNENPLQRTNNDAGPNKEDLAPNAKDEKYKVKVNVDLVTTDATVMGDNVPELRAEDFVVYDNGVVQRISSFSHDLPISLAFVLEPQMSMVGLGERQIAPLSALRFLKPGDQVALYSLNGDRLSNLTEDRLHIAKLVRFLANGQRYDNNILGTLYDAARYLKQETASRRAIILISQNCLNAKGFNGEPIRKSELDRVADRSRVELLASAATLFDFPGTDDRVASCSEFNQKLQNIAEDTGGEMIRVRRDNTKRLSMPKNALESAINRLRTQYSLGFTPSNPGEPGSFHELTVRLANKDRCPTCQVKARRGYYAGVAAPLPPPQKPQAKPVQPFSEIDDKLIQQIMITAGLSYLDFDDISFAIANTAKIEDFSRQSQMMIDLSINPAGMETTILEGRRAYRMQVAFFYSDKKGNLLGSNFWKIDGFLNEEVNNRVMEKRIELSAKVPIKDKDQILKIVIYDEISGRITSKFTKRKGKGLVIDPHQTFHYYAY